MVGPSLGSSLVVGGAEGSLVVGVPDGTRLTLGEADGWALSLGMLLMLGALLRLGGDLSS
jgi:predicted MFS family arabinose efflux permease